MTPQLGLIDLLLLLAPLVLVPLTLSLLRPTTPRAAATLRYTLMLQPVGAIALLPAFLLHPGGLAALCAVPWLAVCALGAATGALFLLDEGSLRPAVLVPAAALAYLFVGASWVMISRAGLHPLGIVEPIDELTGVHFHYAGFIASTLASLVIAASRERRRCRRLSVAAGLLTIVGSPVIAAGFVIALVLLVVGAALLIAGVLMTTVLTLIIVVPLTGRSERVLLTMSSLAAFVPLLLAMSFSVGRAFGVPALTIDQMAAVHGTANAFLFVLPALLGWRQVMRPALDKRFEAGAWSPR